EAADVNHVYPDGTVFPKDPRNTFYSALKDDDPRLQHSIQHLVRFPVSAFLAETSYAAWKDIPSSYMLTTDDGAMPETYQKTMIAEAKSHLGAAARGLHEINVGPGHVPFLTNMAPILNHIILVYELSIASKWSTI